MKKLFLTVCVFFLFIACNEKASERTTDLFSFKLSSADTTQFDFSLLKNNKASVFVFLAPDCPLSQNYTLTLNALNEQFQKDTVAFYGIITGNYFDKNEVKDFVNKYKINFPILYDADLNLTNYFNAVKTPEVFTVDSRGAILYHGAIDNWASDLGVHRKVITEYYLRDALNSIVQNSDVRIKESKAVGCYIERPGKQ